MNRGAKFSIDDTIYYFDEHDEYSLTIRSSVIDSISIGKSFIKYHAGDLTFTNQDALSKAEIIKELKSKKKYYSDTVDIIIKKIKDGEI